MNRLDVHITEDGGNVIVKLTGMADMEAAQTLQRHLTPIIKRRATGFVIMDLSQVSYITSVALGILFWFNGQLKARGRALRLAGMTPGA
jgi:anti-anti-sigma factor